MNSRVDIYIKTERIDLFDDEMISVNSSVQNINDISKVFSDFSQSFTVPASKNNNRIFKHYYNPDIDGGFDARTKVASRIEIGTMTFRQGKLRLEEVKITNNRPEYYKVTFFSNLTNLNDVFQDDYLSELDLSAFDHIYNYDNVKEGLRTGLFSESVIYPMFSFVRRWLYNSDTADTTDTEETVNIAYDAAASPARGINFTEFKPALLVSDIIAAIQVRYGLTFTGTFLSNSLFDNLYMLAHREIGYLTEDIKVDGTLIDWATGSQEYINFATDILSVSSIYISLVLTIDFDYTLTITPDAPSSSVPYEVLIVDEEQNGARIYESGIVTGTFVLNQNLPPNLIVNLEKKYKLKFFVRSDQALTYDAQISVVRNVYGNADPAEVTNSTTQTATSTLSMAQALPRITVKDFLVGIIKKYNCVIIPESEDTFYIETLDNWYDQGQVIDVSKYIDRSNHKISKGNVYNTIKFKHQEPQTLLAKQFSSTNKVPYGDLTVTLEDDSGALLDGEEFEIELPFEQMVYERITDLDDASFTSLQYGFVVDDSLSPSELKDAHLFYSNPVNVSSNPISLINLAGAQEGITTGNVYTPNHSNDVTNKSFTTTWGLELNEYDSQGMQNSLYSLYYLDYITDVFNEKRRVFNYSARFPENLIRDIRLNDLLLIDGRRYKINNMKTELTTSDVELELLNDIYFNDSQGQGLVASNEGQVFSIDTFGLGSWTASNGGDSWIGLSSTSGNDGELFLLTIAENFGADRSGAVQITGNIDVTISIFQYGRDITFDRTDITWDDTTITFDKL